MTRMFVLSAISVLLLPACSSLRVDHVNFGWPVESVVTVTDDNMIDEGRYIVSCSVARIAYEEFQDSTALKGVKLRLLRNSEGYYFLTGPRFKDVYVFTPEESELALKSKIEVSANGLIDPALNQRPPFVELLDGSSFRKLLTSDDIVEGKKK